MIVPPVTACPRCGVEEPFPCVTPAGLFAPRRHAGRPELDWDEWLADLLAEARRGDLERLAEASIDAAEWLDDDVFSLAKGVVLGLARQMDDAAEFTDAMEQLGFLDDMVPKSAKALSPREKAYTWVASILIQYLDRLGLTATGQKALELEREESEEDDVTTAAGRHLAEQLAGG